jgi:hypothetical protein
VKPNDRAPKWNNKNCYELVDQCRVFLKVHSFISDSESAKVVKRIDKWLDKNGLQRTEAVQ